MAYLDGSRALLLASALALPACTNDNPEFNAERSTVADATGETGYETLGGSEGGGSNGGTQSGDGDGDPPPGDGDGEPPPGDGDGEPPPGDGDGEPPSGDGDGEPPSGDGDGEPEPGDGDGEPEPGDGDGDWTGDGDGDEPFICEGLEQAACIDEPGCDPIFGQYFELYEQEWCSYQEEYLGCIAGCIDPQAPLYCNLDDYPGVGLTFYSCEDPETIFDLGLMPCVPPMFPPFPCG